MTERAYRPSPTGIHICGADADEFEPITVADYPFRSGHEARRVWEILRDEYAATAGEPDDLIVDLNIAAEGGCNADFPITRQMLAPMTAALERLAS